MSAGITSKLFPTWNQPVDFKKTFRGKRIFGSHKTIRGLIAGTITGGIIFVLQGIFMVNVDFSRTLALPGVDYANLLIGFLMGFGALTGDMVKSFFKRQISIKPGHSWLPFDQIDWIIGSLFFIMPFTQIPYLYIFWAFLLGFFLSITVKYVGFLLRLDDKPI